MAVVITITNQKGGVSKTTTTRHLAHFLAAASKRVLVIDNDPQASLTRYYGYNPEEVRAGHGTLEQAYLEKKTLEEIIIPHSVYENIAPGSLGLADAAIALLQDEDPNGALKWAMKDIKNQFDVILIDNGPSLDKLGLNALNASDYVLIPTKTDMLSIDGIGKLVGTVSKMRRANPDLQILGVVPTIYHHGRVADEGALQELRSGASQAGIRVFDPIPAATAYDRAFPEGKAVFEIDPNAAGRLEYQRLADVISNL